MITATILNAFQAGGINLVSARDESGQLYLITDLPPVENGQELMLTENGWIPRAPATNRPERSGQETNPR